MRRLSRPRRFSIRRKGKGDSEGPRFNFRKYRRKEPIKTHYILWLFIVFVVVLFLVKWLSGFGR
ncbi:MAG: hypothetical protein ACE5OR_04060 [bacterium]